MSTATVLILCIVAGLVLVVGGALVMYMSNIVKNAYEIKVALNDELDDRLKKMDEELDKKSKWIKKDLIDEFDKIKTGMQTDNARRFDEFGLKYAQRLSEIEDVLRKNQGEIITAMGEQRAAMNAFDQKLNILRRDQQRRAEPAKTENEAAAPETGPATAGSAANETGATEPAANGTASSLRRLAPPQPKSEP